MLETKSEEESAKIFMFKFMRTFDPHQEGQVAGKIVGRSLEHLPSRAFPERDYIHDFIDAWLAELLLAISKSRQMLGTWTGVGLYCWDTYRHAGRVTIFKSIDKLHSGVGNELALLWRAQFIHDHLPKCVRPRMNIKRRDNVLQYPDTGSAIIAATMEGSFPRTFTANGCLDDETAVQQYAEAGYSAIKPLLGPNGRYTAISTPMGENFWERLVNDKFDE